MMNGSIHDSLVSCGLVGSSYLVVFVGIWVITCVSGKGPKCGVKFWYQFGSGMISLVVVYGSCFAASLAQCIVFWASVSLCGWAYPIPCHLCENAFPMDPKILSLGNGEKNFVRWVEHVTWDEK